MTEKFLWPCHKRKPHGPHRIEPELHDFDCDWEPDDNEGPCGCGQDCPGVRAHPLTQIGKGTLPEVPERESTEGPWPQEVTQRMPDTYWDIVNSKVQGVGEGEWVTMISPTDGQCAYKVISLDPETRMAVLRRAGS